MVDSVVIDKEYIIENSFPFKEKLQKIFNRYVSEYHNFEVSDIEENVPYYPGIYLLYNNENVLMYVGKSVDLYYRLMRHVKEQTHISYLTHNFKKYRYIKCKGMTLKKTVLGIEAVELYLINILKPKLNVRDVITYDTSRYDWGYIIQDEDIFEHMIL